jgi:hypothetical protein
MADWPQVVRDRLFGALLVVGVAAFAGLALTALWPLLVGVAHWGPVFWASVGALALTCLALYAWYRRVHESHVLAAIVPFSFADVVVRMRAKEHVRALRDAGRREANAAGP